MQNRANLHVVGDAYWRDQAGKQHGVMGKIEIERLLAERAIQLGDRFTRKRFMDEFAAVGVIPVSMERWELTGYDTEVSR